MTAEEEQANAASGLIGQWRLISFDLEDQASGERTAGFGPDPKGRIVMLSSGYLIVVLTAAGRPVPRTDEDRAAAFKQTIAYSGPFEIEGDKLKVAIDVTWNEAWGGTVQARTFKLTGSRLSLISDWTTSPIDSGRIARGILEWERET